MRKAITFFVVLTFFGCRKNINIFPCKGIPNENQAFSYMYFKNEKEGYLFGTLTHYEEMSDKDLESPNFNPKSTDEANVYKTLDGGNSWEKIDGILNYGYFDIATYLNNAVYILRKDVKEDFKFNIMQFNLSNSSINLSEDMKAISSIWTNDKSVFFTNNRGNINLYSLNQNMQLKDSLYIEDYVIDGISLKNIFYTIFSNKKRTYFGVIDGERKRILELNIVPKDLTVQDNNRIVISGNNKGNDNEIDLVSYNVDASKSEIIKKFKGYSIVQGLQSNDKVIAGFIGNISGAFTKYDLFYSLDRGKTWHIQKLEEARYIRPSCLVDNIMYIYSGGARMQKFFLK